MHIGFTDVSRAADAHPPSERAVCLLARFVKLPEPGEGRNRDRTIAGGPIETPGGPA